MSYTIVGLFEEKKHIDKAVSKLTSNGINEPNIDVSPYRTEGDYEGSDYDYERREENESFWDKLFGRDSQEKEVYSRAGSRNHVVTVHAQDKAQAIKASEILDDAGARDVNAYNQDWNTPGGKTTNTPGNNEGRRSEESSKEQGSVDVVNENINVGKREVQDRDVQLKSRIVEKPVEENVRLRNERVYVKREPVNKKATNEDFKEKTVQMKESHEEPVVEKDARVVEKVSLKKDVNSKDEKVRDTVRETKVDVNEDKDRKDRR